MSFQVSILAMNSNLRRVTANKLNPVDVLFEISLIYDTILMPTILTLGWDFLNSTYLTHLVSAVLAPEFPSCFVFKNCVGFTFNSPSNMQLFFFLLCL